MWCSAWEQAHYTQIKQRREESSKKKQEQMKAAADQLADFDSKRKVCCGLDAGVLVSRRYRGCNVQRSRLPFEQKTIETNKENNQTAEKGFISERDGALKAGLHGLLHVPATSIPSSPTPVPAHCGARPRRPAFPQRSQTRFPLLSSWWSCVCCSWQLAAGKDSWEKVSSYLDLTSDPKRNNTVHRPPSPSCTSSCHSSCHVLRSRQLPFEERRGTSFWDPMAAAQVARMKSVLIAVKSTPPATVKNFGAA
jgi:hypothetical protein